MTGFVRVDFAGGGGTCEGLRTLGLPSVGVEYMAPMVATLRANGHTAWQVDVTSDECRGYAWPAIWGYCASPECFVAGTPVLTKRGAVAIEEVAVGDEVWTHRNRWRRVTDTMQREAETVTMNGLITSTADHPFYARRQVRKWNNAIRRSEWSLAEPEWVHAADTRGAFLSTPTSVSGAAAPEWHLTPWVAGRWVADGTARLDGDPRQGEIVISVGAGKEEEFEGHAAGWTPRSVRTATNYRLHSLSGAQWLVENFGKLAYGKTLPTWLLDQPESIRREFLDGYLSGDGSSIPNGSRAVTVSERLAMMLNLLAVGLGYTSTILKANTAPTTVIEGRTVNQRPWYAVTMVRNDGRYTRDIGGLRWVKQRKEVVPSGRQRVYDITVDEDHSFVAWGKVVHNCQSFSMAGKGEGRAHLEKLAEAAHKVADGATPEDAVAAVSDAVLGKSAMLSLEPMLVIARHRPTWVVLEQVPAVLPLWEVYAEIMPRWGYSVKTAILSSEQFGVPQTRKRAFLVAHLEREAVLPTPTHSRYYSHAPSKLDDGVLPWVSMADALGVTATMRSNYGTGGDPKARGERPAPAPAPAVTSKIGRNKWVARKRMGSGMVERYGDRPGRELGQPAFTIRAAAGGMEPGGFRWVPETPNGGDASWVDRRPSPTIVGSFRPDIVAVPKYRKPGDGPRQNSPGSVSVSVSVSEAAVLQSFPADYVFIGNQGQRYLQVGNAVPPLLQAAVVSALIGASSASESGSPSR